MAIRWEKFTVKSQEAVQAASQLAGENGNPEVLPLHLLAALVEDKEGIIVPVLEKVGVPTAQLRAKTQEALGKLPKVSGSAAQPNPSAALNKVFERAFKEAEQFKDEYVSTEHLLLALAEQKNDGAQLLLASLARRTMRFCKSLTTVRGTQRVTDQNPEAKYQALEKYAKDLTDLARRGKLDPVIGRDEEIRRVIQVLSRQHEKQSGAHWRARRGQNRHRRRTGAAHHERRRSGDSARQARHRARPGIDACGSEVSRRVRRPAQGHSEGN